MRFASQSLVIISLLGLLASTSAKPTHLRKGHNRHIVPTKALRQFDPHKAPTKRAFGAAPHHSHISVDKFDGFWEFDENSGESDDTGYSYDFSGDSGNDYGSDSGNTLTPGTDDPQPSTANSDTPIDTPATANSDTPIDTPGGMPHPSKTGFVGPAVAPGWSPADSQNPGASGSSPRRASAVVGKLATLGLSPGSSSSFSGVPNTRSPVDTVGSASSSAPPVIDNVAAAPSWADAASPGIPSTQGLRQGHGVARIPTNNFRSGRLGVADGAARRLPTSGSSPIPNSVGNARNSDANTSPSVSSSSPGFIDERINPIAIGV